MRRSLRGLAGWLALLALAGIAALYVLFPGQRFGMAFTIATGIGRPALQARIDGLEARAIRGAAFSVRDRRFLSDFYRTLARGGRLVGFARQTGRMMDHYLDGSGRDYPLQPDIFSGNARVRAQMAPLRRHALTGCGPRRRAVSPTFYMPDASHADSVFGLYYGTVAVESRRDAQGGCRLRWRAEVPWIWPSYAQLQRKYGTPHGESFPLPNLPSLFLGSRHALRIDNGLGEHLTRIGLARPFLAYAEWEERVVRD